MAIVEDVADDADKADSSPGATQDLLADLRGLTKRLELPEHLLPRFMDEDKRT